MTYFTLFCFIFIAFAALILMVRVGILEDHLVKLQHEVLHLTIQADKKDRLRHLDTAVRLWQPVDYAHGEEVDYD